MHRSSCGDFGAQRVCNQRVLTFSNSAIVVVVQGHFAQFLRVFSSTVLVVKRWLDGAHRVVHFSEKAWHQWVRSWIIRLQAHVSFDLFVCLFFSPAQGKLEELASAPLFSGLLLENIFQ